MVNYAYNSKTWYYERTDWGSDTYKSKWWWTTTIWWGKVTTTPAKRWWSSSSSSSSWWSWKTITGGYMQNWKLYNEYSDWTTGLASEWKWWSSWWISWISNWTKTITGGYMQNWKLYNEYSDWSTGLASEWKWTINSSSNPNDISSMKFWQWTADDYQKSRNETLGKYYSGLGKYDYNTIYNDLSKNSWFASASENDKRATVNRIMEQAANASWWTLNTKSQDEIATETQNSEEDIDTTDYDELFNWADEDWRDDYFYDRLYSSKEWNDLTNQVSDLNRQLQANEVKETVPEVKDETYNYNTYFNDNLADKTMHEGWESKDIQDSWLTFAQTIQEPITNALQDLWLLWDNEETANEFPTEQPQQNNYSSWEEVVSAFNNAIQMALNPDNWNGPTDKSITKLYSDYKKQLMIMLNNKQITPEQFKDYLWQIRNNEQLQTFINNYVNNKWQMS